MEPDTKRLKLENEVVPEKEQTGWFDLPYEIRNMIIETMDTPSKCTFSRCSKQCDKEIGMSRNYIEEFTVDQLFGSVEFTMKSRDFFSKLVIRGKVVSVEMYDMEDIKSNADNLFYISKPIKEWKIIEEDDLDSIVGRYFDYILRNASNSFMDFCIDLDNFPFEKTNIRHLKKLKKIKIFKPARDVDLVECGFIDIEQLYKIPEKVLVNGVRMNFEHLLQLKADRIVLESFEMSSEELNQYLKLWANGQLHSNLKHLQMDMRGKRLDKNKVIQGLEFIRIVDEYDYNEKIRFKLRSLSNPDRMAKVRFNEYYFLMCVDKYTRELTYEERVENYEKLRAMEGFDEDAYEPQSSDDEYGFYDPLFPMIRN